MKPSSNGFAARGEPRPPIPATEIYLRLAETPIPMNSPAISASEMTPSILHIRATEQSRFRQSGAQSGDSPINLARTF